MGLERPTIQTLLNHNFLQALISSTVGFLKTYNYTHKKIGIAAYFNTVLLINSEKRCRLSDLH